MSPSPSAQYSLTIRVEIADRPGMLGLVASAIGQAGASIGSIDLVEVKETVLLRDITVDATDADHWDQIVAALGALDGVTVVDTTDRTFLLHVGGKIEIHNKSPLKTRADLSMAYTPGVARVCQAIAEDPDKAFQYTIKRNMVAVVSDGSAVLGLGDIGPRAAMPVMEGKAMLFKEFANVDAFPICLDTHDPDEIVAAVTHMAPGFGGINLEDISAPRCFEIEDRLKAALDIPVFHDDQHGTAIVTLAALINACKLTGKNLADLRVLVIGLGAAGVAVTKILMEAGVRHVIGADSRGVVSTDRADYQDGTMPPIKRWYAEASNPDRLGGTPASVIDGMDLLIGLSGAKVFPAEALARMNKDAMVFAMANPTPEVSPEEAAPYARRRDRPLGLPQPDQQRARVPGDLPRRAGRPGAADHRADEDGRRSRHRRHRARGRAARGLHHPLGLQPRRRTCGGRGRRRRGAPRRRRPRREHDRLRRAGHRAAAVVIRGGAGARTVWR
jgi:malate dehydrogenase (oxaloacetate-decarboxylating)